MIVYLKCIILNDCDMSLAAVFEDKQWKCACAAHDCHCFLLTSVHHNSNVTFKVILFYLILPVDPIGRSLVTQTIFVFFATQHFKGGVLYVESFGL